jgi:hypothetical protein
MKRVSGLALTAFIALCLAFALFPSGSAQTWLDTRDSITTTSGTVGINTEVFNVTDDEFSAGAYAINISLPCPISSLDNASTFWWINNTGGTSETIYFNLTINGIQVNDTDTIADGEDNTTTLWDVENITDPSALNTTYTYLNISFNTSIAADTIFAFTLVADNVSITATWLAANVAIQEYDLSNPRVRPTSVLSFLSVNNSINVTNDIGYTLDYVNLTLTYPSHAFTEPTAYYNTTSMTNDSNAVTYIDYQKNGPYVHTVTDNSVGREHEVVVRVFSHELLTACAEWNMDFTDVVYNGAFDNVHYASLVVRRGSTTIDWGRGSIEMEDLTLNAGSGTGNAYTFTWTRPYAPGVPGYPTVPTEVTEPWYEEPIAGMATYLWIIIIIGIIIILLLWYYLSKK